MSFLLVGLSVLAYGLAAEIYSRYHAYLPSLSRYAAQRHFPGSFLMAMPYHCLRTAYYIGLPYLALRLGIIPINWMGLGDWSATEYDVLKTLALMSAILVITLLTWRGYVGCQDSLHDQPMPDISAGGPIACTLEIIYRQVHWAFYRGAALLWTGGDYQTGIWLGFVLVVLEEMLNPQVRRNLVRPGDAGIAVGIRWVLAASSGVAFMLSRSLWLIMLLHWAIELSNLVARRKQARRSPGNGHMTT